MSDLERLMAQGFWAPAVGEDGERQLVFVLPAEGLERGLQKIIDAIVGHELATTLSRPAEA
jgi:hypothetical protein